MSRALPLPLLLADASDVVVPLDVSEALTDAQALDVSLRAAELLAVPMLLAVTQAEAVSNAERDGLLDGLAGADCDTLALKLCPDVSVAAAVAVRETLPVLQAVASPEADALREREDVPEMLGEGVGDSPAEAEDTKESEALPLGVWVALMQVEGVSVAQLDMVAEAQREAEAEGLRAPVAVAHKLRLLLGLDTREALTAPVLLLLPVRVGGRTLPVCKVLEEALAAEVALDDAQGEEESEADALVTPEKLAVTHAVADTEGVARAVGVAPPLPLWLTLALADTVPEEQAEGVSDSTPLGLVVPHTVLEREEESEAEAEEVTLPLLLTLLLPQEVRVAKLEVGMGEVEMLAVPLEDCRVEELAEGETD